MCLPRTLNSIGGWRQVEGQCATSLYEVLELYHWVMEQSGGAIGIRDLHALASALAQPRMTFGGQELYPTLAHTC